MRHREARAAFPACSLDGGALLMHNLHELGSGLPVVDGYVFSHWALDFVSHSADLPLLSDGSPLAGLGLESSVAVGLVMELSLLAVSAAIYLVARRRTCLQIPGA